MKPIRKYLITLYVLLTGMTVAGQQETAFDSLINLAAGYYYTQPDSAQYVLHKGVDLAASVGNDYKQGIFLTKLISQKTRIKDWDSARYYFRYSRNFLQQKKITTLIPDAHSEIAESYFYMEKMDSALYHFDIADSLYTQNQDSIGILISKNNKANVYQIQGNYKEAIVNLLEAAKNVDTTQYLYIKVELYQNIAQLYAEIGEGDASFEFAQRSVDLALKNPKFPQDVVSAYALRAQRYIEKGDYTAARSDLQQADDWIVAKGLESVRYKVNQARGNLLVAEANYVEAIPFLQDAITQGTENQLNNFELVSLKKNLARAYGEVGQEQKAKALFEELLEEAKTDSRLDDQVALYTEIATIERNLGNFESAYDALVLHVQLKDSILGVEKQEIIKDAMVRYQTLEKEKALLETQANLAKTERHNLRLYGGLALALLVALLGYLFYNQQRLKNRQLKKEAELKEALNRIETQNKLQEQRLRISRDLHDNIGSQLTFITSSLDTLKFRLEDQENPISNSLESISSFTTQTIYELRDTIWAMNKEHISIDDLKGRILNFLDKAGKAKEGIRFSFEHSESLSDEHSVPSIYGMNVYRIIQEAVNNALKYGEPSTIQVDISKNHDHYIVTIKDNGIGFDLNEVTSGNGLNNIRKRAKEISGTAEIVTEPGGGTTVRVEFDTP